MYACCEGKLDIATFLYEQGADLNHSTSNGWLAIHAAAQGGNVEVMEFLMARKCDPNATTRCQAVFSTLGIAAMKGHLDLMKWLIQNGSDPSLKMGNSLTPLHYAACHGHLECARLLLSEGADPNAQSDSGGTPLIEALENGHPDTGMLLIEMGGTFSTTEYANNRLILSILKGDLETARCVLKDTKCDVNAILETKTTFLNFAVFFGQIDIISLLLDNGANLDLQDFEGTTALHMATYSKSLDIIKLLISKGAKTDVIDCFGRTALDWAVDDEECMKIFGPDAISNAKGLDISVVQSAIHRFSQEAKTMNPAPGYVFEALARCLIMIGKTSDGQIAYEQTMERGELLGTFTQTFGCTICSAGFPMIEGVMYTCRVCTLLYVCESCYLNNDGKPTHKICSHLELVKVPRDIWTDLPVESVDGSGKTVMEWLDELEQEYAGTR